MHQRAGMNANVVSKHCTRVSVQLLAATSLSLTRILVHMHAAVSRNACSLRIVVFRGFSLHRTSGSATT